MLQVDDQNQIIFKKYNKGETGSFYVFPCYFASIIIFSNVKKNINSAYGNLKPF